MDKHTSEVELTEGMKLIFHFDRERLGVITCNGIEITRKEAMVLIDQAKEDLLKGES